MLDKGIKWSKHASLDVVKHLTEDIHYRFDESIRTQAGNLDSLFFIYHEEIFKLIFQIKTIL